MSYIVITTIGFLAAILTTISYFPQVIKTIRLKETRDLSLWMYIALTIGQFLWLLYGVFIKDPPLIAANTISFILTGWILILKLRSN